MLSRCITAADALSVPPAPLAVLVCAVAACVSAEWCVMCVYVSGISVRALRTGKVCGCSMCTGIRLGVNTVWVWNSVCVGLAGRVTSVSISYTIIAHSHSIRRICVFHIIMWRYCTSSRCHSFAVTVCESALSLRVCIMSSDVHTTLYCNGCYLFTR